MTLTPAAREHLLALADDEHFIGARHTNWIGMGPFLEEDLAFCSIAQDELGHAIGLYELLLVDAPDCNAGQLDAFAMMREPGAYRSCWLAELECSDWSDSLVRHWLYDRGETLRWEALAVGSDQRVSALATRALREESFHLRHAEQFMARIATTDQSGRVVESIERLLPLATAMWDPVPSEPEALADGFATAASSTLEAQWSELVRADLGRWGLSVDVDDVTTPSELRRSQANRTVRSPGFGPFQTDLQRVIVVDPAAVW